MPIQAVFFDMGGTIETYGWTPELRIQETTGIQKLLIDSGINLGFSDLQLYKIISSGLDAYHLTALETMQELPAAQVFNDYIFKDLPINREEITRIAEELMFFIETHWFNRNLRSELPGVLKEIHQMGLKIGLISNVNSRNQVPANLEKYGIRSYFNPVVLSSEYGRRKPDPAIFHYAARLANVPAGQCVYIGDRIVRDILGARRAGFRLAVQIQHDFDHGEVDEGSTPDAVVKNMDEFLQILKQEVKNTSRSLVEEPSDHSLRALIFDAGDILYYRENSGTIISEFLKDNNLPYHEFPLDQKLALRDKAYQGLIDYDSYQETILRFHGITEPGLLAEGKKVLDQEANNVQFFEGVAETLCSLKKEGYMLGIITDTALPVYVKLNWFERGGFGDVWDSIVSSRELGIRKPNPAIYQAALNQLGIYSRQAVFVGHKGSELLGARAVGMRTIAFNYEEDVSADVYIENFSDLLNIQELIKVGIV